MTSTFRSGKMFFPRRPSTLKRDVGKTVSTRCVSLTSHFFHPGLNLPRKVNCGHSVAKLSIFCFSKARFHNKLPDWCCLGAESAGSCLSLLAEMGKKSGEHPGWFFKMRQTCVGLGCLVTFSMHTAIHTKLFPVSSYIICVKQIRIQTWRLVRVASFEEHDSDQKYE
jgi:hypothetical protein